MPKSFEESPEFRRLIRGEEPVDWATLALELARDAYPNLDSRSYLARLDDLAARVLTRCRPEPRPGDIIGQVNWVLFVEEGFRGNEEDYYDPRNSYLNEVLDRRVGIPISLSVLYQGIAARAGLPMDGVNLPGHFVLRAETERGTWFVDPFHKGAILDPDGCRRRVEEVTGRFVQLSDSQFAPCATLTLIARMLGNLKGIYVQGSDFAAALPVQRRLAALVRDDPLEARDLGVIALHAGFPGEALDPLRRYLDACRGSEDSEAIAALHKLASREVAGWN